MKKTPKYFIGHEHKKQLLKIENLRKPYKDAIERLYRFEGDGNDLLLCVRLFHQIEDLDSAQQLLDMLDKNEPYEDDPNWQVLPLHPLSE